MAAAAQDGGAARGTVRADSGITLRIDLLGIDITAPAANTGHAVWDALWLARAAAASTTTIVGAGSAVAQNTGTFNSPGAGYGVSADTTNACLTLNIAAPNANLTHWVARVTTVEVQ